MTNDNDSPATDTTTTPMASRQVARGGGAIVVVSKCPTPGASKTRLIPLLGDQGAATLAKAMLSDVLMTLTRCKHLDSILKILLYAPGTAEGLQGMTNILNELGLSWRTSNGDNNNNNNTSKHGSLASTSITTSPASLASSTVSWLLLPMQSKVDLQSSDLGDLLEHALDRAREHMLLLTDSTDRTTNTTSTTAAAGGGNGSVVFLGMDSPVLPLDDIVTGLGIMPTTAPTTTTTHSKTTDGGCGCSSSSTSALLCPADDGGYGMLSVPASANAHQTFRGGVQWSHALTAVSQIKALTDQPGISSVRVGTVMYDIDEPEDVTKLCARLVVLGGRGGRRRRPPNANEIDDNYDDDDNCDDETIVGRSTTHPSMVLDWPCRSTLDRGLAAHHHHQQQQPVEGTATRIHSSHPTCLFTRQALSAAGLVG